MSKIIDYEQIDDYFSIRVSGIPAKVFVRSRSIEAEKTIGFTEEFYGETVLDYTIYDRNFYPASWLENKLEDFYIKRDVEEQINLEIDEYLENLNRPMCA